MMVEAAAFDVALAQIDEWIQPNGVNGCSAAIWHRGEIVAQRIAGESRPGVPVDARTVFALASVSKPVTAAAVLAAVQDGALALDEPVIRFVPEFGEVQSAAGTDPALTAAREQVTIRQLLCHISGLPEDSAIGDDRFGGAATVDELTDGHCRLPLRTLPGEHLRYSNSGFAVMARAVERATGHDFWNYADTALLQQLGLSDIIARPGDDVAARLAIVTDPSNPGTDVESYNSAYWRQLAIPWGGLYGTPTALARFAGGFLPSGDSAHPLAAATRAAMIQDHTGGVPGGVESGRVWWPQGAWGLGWEVKAGKRRHWTGDLTSPRTFCHFGQAGTLVWADPERDLALAIFTNRSVARMWSFILTRWVRLSNAVVAAVNER